MSDLAGTYFGNDEEYDPSGAWDDLWDEIHGSNVASQVSSGDLTLSVQATWSGGGVDRSGPQPRGEDGRFAPYPRNEGGSSMVSREALFDRDTFEQWAEERGIESVQLEVVGISYDTADMWGGYDDNIDPEDLER